jgi:hypothetical protein
VKTLFIALAAYAATACKVDTPLAREKAQLHDLSFDVPLGWQRIDKAHPGLETAEWRPQDTENYKESITVMRTELAPAVAKAGEPALEPYLRAAQRSLPDIHMLDVKHVATSKGLTGVRVDVDYVPPGLKDRYRRSHAVFVDGTQLVHVLYTARHDDADPAVLDLVVENLAHKEG